MLNTYETCQNRRAYIFRSTKNEEFDIIVYVMIVIILSRTEIQGVVGWCDGAG